MLVFYCFLIVLAPFSQADPSFSYLVLWSILLFTYFDCIFFLRKQFNSRQLSAKPIFNHKLTFFTNHCRFYQSTSDVTLNRSLTDLLWSFAYQHSKTQVGPHQLVFAVVSFNGSLGDAQRWHEFRYLLRILFLFSVLFYWLRFFLFKLAFFLNIFFILKTFHIS